MSNIFRNFAVYKLSVSPLKSVSYMFDKDLYDDDYVTAWDEFFEHAESESQVARSTRQGLRPDTRRRAAIVARKIESARRMMSAFGRPMKF